MRSCLIETDRPTSNPENEAYEIYTNLIFIPFGNAVSICKMDNDIQMSNTRNIVSVVDFGFKQFEFSHKMQALAYNGHLAIYSIVNNMRAYLDQLTDTFGIVNGKLTMNPLETKNVLFIELDENLYAYFSAYSQSFMDSDCRDQITEYIKNCLTTGADIYDFDNLAKANIEQPTLILYLLYIDYDIYFLESKNTLNKFHADADDRLNKMLHNMLNIKRQGHELREEAELLFSIYRRSIPPIEALLLNSLILRSVEDDDPVWDKFNEQFTIAHRSHKG